MQWSNAAQNKCLCSAALHAIFFTYIGIYFTYIGIYVLLIVYYQMLLLQHLLAVVNPALLVTFFHMVN